MHPVVRVHPVTGERGLFIGGFAQRIEGLSIGESRDLLRLLQSYVTRPENVVRVAVGAGPAGAVRQPDHPALRDRQLRRPARRLNRVTVAGDIPVGVDGAGERILEGDASHYTSVA